MPTTEQLRQKLVSKLKELFQLDEPDLDFGFYRIMHAKADQVTRFIEEDLLKIIHDAFGKEDENRTAELKAAFEKAIESAKSFGVPNPEESEPVQQAKAALEAAKDTASAEGEIYDHLYRFFERYYDNGDFVSLRYYARETEGKAAPYAIPYSGEEVKLHWANADQYYIKTAEHFNNFTLDLSKTQEIEADAENLFGGDEAPPLRVHFRIVDAAEGEHGNVKEDEKSKRFFIIHEDCPVEVNEEGELVANFEYRQDPDKTGQDAKWQQRRNEESIETILEEVEKLVKAKKANAEYDRLLNVPAPTEKDKNRPLLAKYVNQYTGRNSMDYFIHKDLGGFLCRELDFYIKNEVMHLDDIENAEVPKVESYLSKIRVIRQIAGKLITFLAQLEDFQKKLWLKKKFVTETNYCITLDRIAEHKDLLEVVFANEAQAEEWEALFALDLKQLDKDYAAMDWDEFLSQPQYKHLVVDTQFYDEAFKQQLLSTIDDFDEQCDGLLIHSENFQALNCLQERYHEQVNCVHIDPPYNTATSGFLYKNTYQHSSWLSLMNCRVSLSIRLLNQVGSMQCHIDENEYENLFTLLNSYSLQNAGTVVWDKRNPMNGGAGVAMQHEYVVWLTNQSGPIYLQNKTVLSMLSKASALLKKYGTVDEKVRKEYSSWVSSNSNLSGGEKAYRNIDEQGRIYQSVSLRAPEPRKDKKFHTPLIHPITKKPCSMPPNGFSRTPETLQSMLEDGLILFGKDETTQPRQKVFLNHDTRRQISSVCSDAKKGKFWTDALGVAFPYCHPVSIYEELIGAVSHDLQSIVLDYFAGSGTTGHAIFNLNREDGGQRKYILVEMGNHFDNVLKPRIAKVVYSADWKNGEPQAPETGVSHCFKYIRLESYEDTLNNLELEENDSRSKALEGNAQLREDYTLRYMLDMETKESQSLLNIDNFADPTQYELTVKKPGSNEHERRHIDLIETFNYLIGLRVEKTYMPEAFSAETERVVDPELPEDQHTKLTVKGWVIEDNKGDGQDYVRNVGTFKKSPGGTHWFRQVEGWVPADPSEPNNGQREKVLIVWRKLTGDIELDNLMLDCYLLRHRINPNETSSCDFDTIYVNGSNNLPNLQRDEDQWKVRLIEEEFMKRMWDVEGV